MGFDTRGIYLLPSGRFGRNVVIFGVHMSSSVHVVNKGKDILVPGKGPTQELGEDSLTSEKMFSVNFTDNGEKYFLSLHYIGVIYLLMAQKLLNLKQNILGLLQLHYV